MKNRDIYKEDGMVIYIKGQLVLGIHPNNLENNIQLLDEGKMKIDWKGILERIKQNKEG